MDKIAPYAKAITSAIIAALGALGVALTPDAGGVVSVTAAEYVGIVTAFLVSSLVVWAIPNKDPNAEHQAESVQPPDDQARGILGKA
jgi:hypothetical protein